MTIADLTRRFAIDGSLSFRAGPGDLIMIDVTADGGRATISLYAGQVLSFVPDGKTDLLFLSEQAYYAKGKAIKGGMPVCWPWFGPDPDGLGRPGHGFARTRPWDVMETRKLADGRVMVVLGLACDAETRAIWPHSFVLAQEIVVGDGLEVALVTRNSGQTTFTLSQALHTYFRVGDIERTRIRGLDGCAYIDKMEGGAVKSQSGPVVISSETDRIYTGVPAALSIEDDGQDRRILVESKGSASAVVWNPWQDTAKAMADLADEDYRHMICVETTNAGPDLVAVPPGAVHRLEARIRLG
ncbi:Aldose 1-epimerase [Magnetospirillum sp. LM-5]|uniref:D-hexose-6-phosphate mutarotase n=1 Tax=Magnetospirillum sp. LM-5 TaxID=2681466 RepID=UPI00137F7398|nr:D-hexose-6-phosphate mutarotase [Magnetospirillum sp. LM-5]CAA7612624.1 Aldose 1-epimerase [Magnetospirillum sp. LM-5]